MYKKVLALAAGALFSLNASAGYIQYNLSGPVSGFFIQNDVDRSVALYDLRVNSGYAQAHFVPSGIYDSLLGASYKSYNMGPTSFGAYDRVTEVYDSTIYLSFYDSGTPGTFNYWATYSQVRDPGYPTDPWVTPLHPLTVGFGGTAVAAAPPAWLAESLDYAREHYGTYDVFFPIIVPTREVPEPGSLALLAIGAIGVGSISRRRKARG